MEQKIKVIKNKAVSRSLPFAVNSNSEGILCNKQHHFEKVISLGCSTSRITFQVFIIFEGWWWLSDRTTDSSIN
jgi:hypothetical protein